MDKKTKKILAGFMIATMLTMTGCSLDTALSEDEENEESGIVTSVWDNNSQRWNYYHNYHGKDYYFGSGNSPHSATTINPLSPGVAKSAGPVSIKKMSDGGFTKGIRSNISSAKGGIGGGGARVSAAS